METHTAWDNMEAHVAWSVNLYSESENIFFLQTLCESAHFVLPNRFVGGRKERKRDWAIMCTPVVLKTWLSYQAS